MPRKDAPRDDIDPAGAAKVLQGLAADLAATVRARAESFMAETAGKATDLTTIDREMRTVAVIARAALVLQTLQAAEDKAADRALARAARCAHARTLAQGAIRTHPINPEGDETDMNDRDPRLDTPEGVAEVYREAERGLDDFFRRLETKRASQPARDSGRGVDHPHQLAPEGAIEPAAP